MKQRNLKKKVGSLLLAVAMIVTSFPAFSHEVYSAELPDSTQFATVDELKNFDTNDGTANKAAKVYFGNNNQQWWIAGSQNGNVTLFAASPLATKQKFEPNADQDKQYNANWNCDYTSTGGSNPTEVYANHYGASPLRTTLKKLETSYFTGTEQNLMKDTTIYTNDLKNGNIYSTTDKLYLAYADANDGQCITVGTNSQNSLNNGLRIDKSYWGNSGDFWLRAPTMGHSRLAMIADPSGYLYDYAVLNTCALVPAFELNLSSVLFASAAPAASSNGPLDIKTVNDKDKPEILPIAQKLVNEGYEIYATSGTAKFFKDNGLENVMVVPKIWEGTNSIPELIHSGKLAFIINTPTKGKESNRDGFKIRRMAAESKVPCFTAVDTVVGFYDAIAKGFKEEDLEVVDIAKI